MFPIQYELKGCKIFNMETDEILLEFDARAIRERTENNGWAGTGVASGSHKYSIATAAAFNFEVGNHGVLIGDNKYIIVSKHPITSKKLGERFSNVIMSETVLELE